MEPEYYGINGSNKRGLLGIVRAKNGVIKPFCGMALGSADFNLKWVNKRGSSGLLWRLVSHPAVVSSEFEDEFFYNGIGDLDGA